MKQIKLLLAVLLLFSLPLFSQKTILNDTDIVWAGETVFNFHPDLNRVELQKIKIYGSTHVLKKEGSADLQSFSENDEHLTLAEKILNPEFLSSPEKKIYADSMLYKLLSAKEREEAIQFLDSFYVFDPETFTEIKISKLSRLNSFEIVHYKIRAEILFNKKDLSYRCRPIAIAPVSRQGKTVFWIPLEETNQINLNNPDINWAVRTSFACPLGTDKIKILKKADKSPVLILSEELKNGNITVFPPMSTLGVGYSPMSKVEMSAIVSDLDTIIVFDPKTFEKTMHMEQKNFNQDAVKQIRFIQDWFWDNKTGKLYFRNLGFAPIIERYDEKGNFLSSGPVFYKRENNID
jgi:hypothetical protein